MSDLQAIRKKKGLTVLMALAAKTETDVDGQM
jgi:hypothetical protein